MKKTDIILISTVFLIGIIAYFLMQITVNNSALVDGVAVVIYKDEKILEIQLEDGSYEILNTELGIEVDGTLFTIPDTNGTHDLVIEYKDNKVRVKEETSPQNICSIQGWSNSPLAPITCLPNNLVILIERPSEDTGIDDVTS